MSKMQKVWADQWLSPENYSPAVGEAMKDFAILFANFVGNRPFPEYSKSLNKWRWWDNDLRKYRFCTTEDLMNEFLVG